MSEDSEIYDVQSSESLAQVEPEADYYRRQIRRIEHATIDLENGHQDLDDHQIIARVRTIAAECLRRPRSNGEKFDRLERELAELRADIIDYDILRRDYREAQEKIREFWRDMGPVEGLVRATVGELAMRIDRWTAGRKG